MSEINQQLVSMFQMALELRSKSTEDYENSLVSFVSFCIDNHRISKAQLFQDLLVLFLLKQKREGFFVEFGATDGVFLSNSYLLEKYFGWNGILAEPARCWHSSLPRNRTANIDMRCVWNESNRLMSFSETKWAEISTLSQFSDKDFHGQERQDATIYEVETVSLNDLLISHDAPKHIDYLSIDTEGSELSILEAFDFDRFDVKILSVEHNHTQDREKIHSLLVSHGFKRIFEVISYFDDWYINTTDPALADCYV